MINKHKRFMLRAVELARRAEGKTFPNPLVGAVIVKDGIIVGEGWHKKAGSPHAEIIALRKAREKAEDADLYVSLEPCAHYGRTPPCVNAIKKRGIKRVYAAMADPNPIVNGRGLDFLKKNGIEVKLGICRREAVKLNPEYIKKAQKKCLQVLSKKRVS